MSKLDRFFDGLQQISTALNQGAQAARMAPVCEALTTLPFENAKQNLFEFMQTATEDQWFNLKGSFLSYAASPTLQNIEKRARTHEIYSLMNIMEVMHYNRMPMMLTDGSAIN